MGIKKATTPVVAGAWNYVNMTIYLRFLLALFASISCFVARRFLVFFERDVRLFSIPVALFAMSAIIHYLFVMSSVTLEDYLG